MTTGAKGGMLQDFDRSVAPAIKLIDASSCVSFDLFDTLVRRKNVFFPKDLFAIVESKAIAALGPRGSKFAQLREQAESAARAQALRDGHREITFAEIHAILARRMKLSAKEQSILAALELDCERASLEKDENAAFLYDHAAASGKVVVVTTDTYFEESFIEEVLQRFGYTKALLCVSSRHRCVKHDGSLFDALVRQTGLAPSRILHIGDNLLSDVTMPASRGIKSWLYLSGRRLFQTRLTGAAGRSDSTAVSRILCEINDAYLPGAKSDATNRVAMCLAFLLLGFTLWLERQVRERGVNRVYFVAREGLIMRRCFDALARLRGTSMETRYFILSRTSLYPSLIFSDPDLAMELFGKSWGKTTLGDAVARLSLSFEEVGSVLRRYGFKHADERLQPSADDSFRAFMQANWKTIKERNRQKNADVISYLEQEKFLESEDVVLVDLGWHLTLQRCLGALSSAWGLSRAIHGRYLGTFKVDRYDFEGDALGFVTSYGNPSGIADLLRSGPSLIELLHGAEHGTTLGYRGYDGKVEPILDENAIEKAQHKKIVAPIQSMALRYFDAWTAAIVEEGDVAIARELCAGVGLGPVQRPTLDEAILLGRLKHAQDFGGRMKSITGAKEWNLSRISGDLLPDGTVPMWRPGFQVLRTAKAIELKKASAQSRR